MPNHCFNRVTIDGPADKVAAFRKAINLVNDESGNTFSMLDTLIPRPESVVDNGTWYEWSITNWGTKWSEYDQDVHTDDADRLTITFTTAWSPCLPGITTISKMFPGLTFTHDYNEEGMQFAGTVVTRNGVTFAHVEAGDEGLEMPQWDGDDNTFDDYHNALQDLYDTIHTEAVTAASV